jgi:hypothetical protein
MALSQTRHWARLALTAWLVLSSEWMLAAPAPSGFQAGFAERDISPSIGMEQPGGYGKAFHTSFHDPCKVRAAVFWDGQTRVALVGVDALIVPRQLVEGARQGIQQTCGIPPEAVLIGASHSHSSGPTGMIQPGEYDQAPDLIKRLASQESSCADAGYLERVRTNMIEAVTQADRSRKPARCGFGRGQEDQVSFNRRLRMKDGVTWSHPGQGNPDIVGYAGPIDPDVGVIGAWDGDGKLLGCIVNFACHATTNPGGISANWIYYLEKAVRGNFGPDVPVVFLQGPCGDVTQVDNLSPKANPAPEKWAQLVGGRVGAEAVKVLLSMDTGTRIPLAATTEQLMIKRRVPRPERVRAARELVTSDRPNTNATEWAFAKETLLLDALLRWAPEATVEVQAVQVGPAVFLANPAEYFVLFGIELKRESPFPFTFPVELANGCVGYVPTEEAFSPQGGGYETRLTSYSNLEPRAGRRIAEACLNLARRLTSGPVPQPEPAPAFRGPWSYGNVPAEVE